MTLRRRYRMKEHKTEQEPQPLRQNRNRQHQHHNRQQLRSRHQIQNHHTQHWLQEHSSLVLVARSLLASPLGVDLIAVSGVFLAGQSPVHTLLADNLQHSHSSYSRRVSQE